MPNGLIIINKPREWTSMDVCAKLRGVFHEKRVGHAGTLDPMATGVLPVFLGRATRAVSLAPEHDKEYIAKLKLGVMTNTQDIWGEVTETRQVTVTRADVEAVLPRFVGELEQIPPMYSAVKVGGKKLYELARKGVEVERKPRRITVYALELLEDTAEENCYRLRVRCSKGTYIRTLCEDIGQALGCGGCMAELTRSVACGFSLEQAHTLEEVLSHPAPQELVLPVDRLFADRPALTLTPRQTERLLHGGSFSLPAEGGEYRAYSPQGTFLALCKVEEGTLSTVKSFFEV